MQFCVGRAISPRDAAAGRVRQTAGGVSQLAMPACAASTTMTVTKLNADGTPTAAEAARRASIAAIQEKKNAPKVETKRSALSKKRKGQLLVEMRDELEMRDETRREMSPRCKR